MAKFVSHKAVGWSVHERAGSTDRHGPCPGRHHETWFLEVAAGWNNHRTIVYQKCSLYNVDQLLDIH
jgi:hypothetical protein